MDLRNSLLRQSVYSVFQSSHMIDRERNVIHSL